MMYDGLIKRLRNCATEAAPCNTCDYIVDGSCTDTLMKQAADAIEELIAERDVFLTEMTHEHNRAARLLWEKEHGTPPSAWIPVTERLPGYMENVLVTDGVFSGMGWRDWYDYRGTKSREDYWISPNTNVKDFGITHWMPLPQPPKEE